MTKGALPELNGVLKSGDQRARTLGFKGGDGGPLRTCAPPKPLGMPCSLLTLTKAPNQGLSHEYR